MGTRYNLTVVSPHNKFVLSKDELKKDIDSLLVNINQKMSNYIPDSEISRFNHYKSTDWFAVSKDLLFVVSSAQDVSNKTNGSFDITMAPLIDLWGFGAKVQLEVPTDIQIRQIKKYIGYNQLNIRRNPPALRKSNSELRIDLSAIAKGFAVDKVAEYLKKQGYSSFLVEIGGEIKTQGFNQQGKPWNIGVETPVHKVPRISEKLIVSNLSVATSGDYRNYFVSNGVRYSHTISPVTGKPIKHSLASVTVLDQSAMLADAYATAFMVIGEEASKTLASKYNLRISMTVRDGNTFKVWQNLDQSKIQISEQKCQKQGGCIYFE